ncbi:major facilitator superfamily domain-containing protein [Umbelopsis sp. PMI_123]|nr:major facilitator superfamily domain-containing protein [Umbelopsis sp. PMI_123]
MSSIDKDIDITTVENTHVVPNDPELEARERALVRKLDMRIVPMLTFLYICQRLDNSNIGNAKVAGLQTDLGLSNSQYSWCISIYTLGVIAMQVPSNMVLERTRPSIYLPTLIALWSVVSALTALVKDYKSILLVRFFLGITEAGYWPGAVFILSTFYKPHEIAMRNSIFYCGNWLSGALGGALAGAIITGMEGKGGLPGWRWLFILEGCITFVVAFFAVWALPDYPGTTSWLTEEEKDLAVRRLGQGKPKEKFSFSGLKSAIIDYKIWVFIIIFMAIQTGGQLNYFMPTIIQNIGYTGSMTQYMTIPVYVFAAILSLIVSVLSDRQQVRSPYVAFCMIVAVIGYIFQISTTNKALLFFSLFLCGGGVWASLGVSLAWLGDCVPGPRDKKAIGFALLNMISQLSNFYGPQLYTDPPRYLVANIVILVYMSIGVLLCFGLRFLLIRANRRLDDKYGVPMVEKRQVIPDDRDVADVAPETGVNKNFRYLL